MKTLSLMIVVILVIYCSVSIDNRTFNLLIWKEGQIAWIGVPLVLGIIIAIILLNVNDKLK